MDWKNLDSSDIAVVGLALVGIVICAIAFIVAAAALWAFPVMWCWNYLSTNWVELPFAMPIMTWVKAFALFITCSMLLRSAPMHTKFGVFGQFGLTIFALMLSTLSSFILQWSWNHSVVDMFDFPVLNWGQSFCLLFLSNFLFKSSSFHQLEKQKDS